MRLPLFKAGRHKKREQEYTPYSSTTIWLLSLWHWKTWLGFITLFLGWGTFFLFGDTTSVSGMLLGLGGVALGSFGPIGFWFVSVDNIEDFWGGIWNFVAEGFNMTAEKLEKWWARRPGRKKEDVKASQNN